MIWSWIANFISYDDNRYNTSASTLDNKDLRT